MRHFYLFLLLAFLCITPKVAQGYTRHYTDIKANVFLTWPRGGPIPLSLSVSLKNPPSNIKKGSDVVGAVLRALAHWEAAADVRFDLSWSERVSVIKNGVDKKDGLITIADTPENRSFFKNGVIGYTNLSYNNDTGIIGAAGVLINPAEQFSTDGTFGTYDLEGVFTHEIGHLIGLEHSAFIGAVMQPTAGINGLYGKSMLMNRTLTQDDEAGARAIYGSHLSTGSLQGQVRYDDGKSAYGIHVWAEDRRTGQAVAGNISLSSGYYRIDGLPAGIYRIFASNICGPVSASQIPSEKSAYSALQNEHGMAAWELPNIADIQENQTSLVNMIIDARKHLMTMRLSDSAGEVSKVPVLIVKEMSAHVYISFKKADQLAEVKINSPYIWVTRTSLIH